MKTIKNSLWTLILILVLGACGPKKDNNVNLIYVNWAEGIAMTNVAKVVLENKGYNVKLMNADVAPIFASLSRGSADVFMDVWLPVTHHDYMKQYETFLEVLGNNFDDARIGLVVPTYVTVNSIDELNANRDNFDAEIIGIDAGAGIMKAAEKAIEEYNLNFKLMTSSEAAMTAILKKSIDNEKWIVVTGWTPHWMFSRFDLKMLEDPKKIFGEAETIKTIARKGFSQDQPYVAAFFQNISFTPEQIASLMATIEELGNECEGAKIWVEENEELVNSWLPVN